MKEGDIERLSFVVSEVYDLGELRNVPFMLSELQSCYPALPDKTLVDVIAKARKLKWSYKARKVALPS